MVRGARPLGGQGGQECGPGGTTPRWTRWTRISPTKFVKGSDNSIIGAAKNICLCGPTTKKEERRF